MADIKVTENEFAKMLDDILGSIETYFGSDFLPYYVRAVYGRRTTVDIINRATFLVKRFKAFFTRLETYEKDHKYNLLNLDTVEKQVLRIMQQIVDIDAQIIDNDVMLEETKKYCKTHLITNTDEILDYISAHSDPINIPMMDLLERNFEARYKLMDLIGVHSKFIKFLTKGYKKIKTVDEYLDKFKTLVGQSIVNMSEHGKYDGPVKIGYEDFALEAARAEQKWRIGTSLPILDYVLNGGFEGGRVYLFAGASGGGKSLVLINLAMRALLNLGLWPDQSNKKGVLYITLENSVDETRSRYLCSTSRATRYQVTTANKNLSHGIEVKTRFGRYIEAIHDLYFYVLWRPAKTVNAVDIIRFVKQIESQDGVAIKMVIIDYLDKMISTEFHSDEPEWMALGRIVDELKSVAINMNIPILSVSQVNRSGYVRGSNAIYGETIAGSIRKKENADFLMTMNFSAKREIDTELFKKQNEKKRKNEDNGDSELEKELKDSFDDDIKTKPVEVVCYVDKNRDGPANIELKLYIDYSAYALSYDANLLTQSAYKHEYAETLEKFSSMRQAIKNGTLKIDPTGRRRNDRPAF